MKRPASDSPPLLWQCLPQRLVDAHSGKGMRKTLRLIRDHDLSFLSQTYSLERIWAPHNRRPATQRLIDLAFNPSPVTQRGHHQFAKLIIRRQVLY